MKSHNRSSWRVAQTAIDDIIAHAREAQPNECCGVLIGHDHAVMRAVRGQNLDASPTRFLLDPRDHFAAIREARASGHRVVGVYHSHPNGSSQPSAADIAEASYSEYVYAIVALTIDVAAVRFFCLETGNFLELPFVTLP